MNLFVLVSTGQKVANLPPVLEHARVGDHVLWIESDEAQRKNWTRAPRALLEDRGLVTVATARIEHVNDPARLAAVLAPYAETAGQYEAVFLVANGGTKLTPVGLLFGFERCNARLLYGDAEPAVHSLFPSGLDVPTAGVPYTQHDLDLPDILRLNGYTFATASPPTRLWPDPLPKGYADEPYGANPVHTFDLHARHHARAAAPPAGARVPFADLARLAPVAFTKWGRAVQDVRNALNPQTQAGLYHSTLKLDEAARRAAGAADSAGAAPPIGDAFERAVGRRVRAWLEGTGHPAVQSVWSDVAVARDSSPHQKDVQFDILLVLRNGVLIHLECKSALVDVRDLDARIHRLRETGSQLARLAVVLPVYTTAVERDWFATIHAARAQVQQARLSALAFTWPGQPERYTVPGSDPPEEVACPAFEAALDDLLRPYRP